METKVEAGTLVGNTIAIPADLTALDGEGKEREVLAVVNDANIGEPFTVYKSANAWWTDVSKVEKLMFCFKNDMSVEEALFSVGISRNNYYYFLKIHPEFSNIKVQLLKAFPAVAKLTLGQALQKDPNLALRYLQGAQPENYRRSVLPDMPPGATGGYARRTEELFTNEKGEVVVSRKTAIALEHYGNDNDTPEPSK